MSLVFSGHSPVPEYLQGFSHSPLIDVSHEQLVFDQRLPGLVCSEGMLRKLLRHIGESHLLQAQGYQVYVLSQFSVHLEHTAREIDPQEVSRLEDVVPL